MSSPMTTDLAAASASAGRISGDADTAQGIIGQMQGVVDELNALWKGSGADAFQVGSADIQAQLQKAQAALQEVSDKFSHNNTGYDTADSTNASSLSNTGL
ncbi:hypothetical protein NJBCHELONAE_43480 [Mycobacteroides chelonae]|uniref:WXG100 family type VII secretion target n=1 Tax=Mycobacteroides chelonae TaxID=1774 RepID=UPI0021DDF111|nr:WXG100 family type VII secretion target [Mycobacteroides chelonae]GLE59037.1 hypothetical protein NJBCHELONAE_43480 [Mycobacteroides chelonae]